jgi:hypothetical protein
LKVIARFQKKLFLHIVQPGCQLDNTAIASNPTKYANDYFDVTLGHNQTSSIPGYSASTGWDAVTGLGSPNAANLIPDLIAATS